MLTHQSPAALLAYAFRYLMLTLVAVVCISILWAGTQQVTKVFKYTVLDGIRDEEMRPELVPAVAALKRHTGLSAVAYVYDAADATGRTVRELAFPSTVIFTSETAARADCIKQMRAQYEIRFLVAVKPLEISCVAQWTRIADATPRTPPLWIGELR